PLCYWFWFASPDRPASRRFVARSWVGRVRKSSEPIGPDHFERGFGDVLSPSLRKFSVQLVVNATNGGLHLAGKERPALEALPSCLRGGIAKRPRRATRSAARRRRGAGNLGVVKARGFRDDLLDGVPICGQIGLERLRIIDETVAGDEPYGVDRLGVLERLNPLGGIGGPHRGKEPVQVRLAHEQHFVLRQIHAQV